MGVLVKNGRALIAFPKGDRQQAKSEKDPLSYISYTSYPREARDSGRSAPSLPINAALFTRAAQ